MSQQTKQKILDAALNLFTQHGFAGTSMGKIAKQAGVNHSLLFHHFGNKVNLWVEVKQYIVERATQSMAIVPSTSLSFSEFLHDLFTNMLSFYANHPEIRQMIYWQRIENTGDTPIQIGMTRESDTWLDAFKHYQQQGDIAAQIPPEFAVTFVISLISGIGIDPIRYVDTNEAKQHYVDFCVDRTVFALQQHA